MSASPSPLFRTQPLFPFIQEHHCPRLILLSLLGGLIIKLIITYKVAQEWLLLGQVASKCFGLSSANRARASTSLLITVLSASKETNWSDWCLPLIGLSFISQWAKMLLVMVRVMLRCFATHSILVINYLIRGLWIIFLTLLHENQVIKVFHQVITENHHQKSFPELEG